MATIPSRSAIAAFVKLALVALGLLGLARPAAGSGDGMSLTFSDDLVSGNAHPDDLYTAELLLESRAGSLVVRLGERMFTRREAGRRFDETFADLSLDRLELGDWEVTPRLGVLRVGKGLGGERAQNEIHRWVGSEPVRLRYIEGRHWYPTFEVAASRAWSPRGGLSPRLRFAGYAAPRFRQWLRGDVAVERAVGRDVTLRAGVGLQINRAEFELLEGVLRDSGPTAELGVGWRALHLSWTYNDFGTRAGAISVGVDFGALR